MTCIFYHEDYNRYDLGIDHPLIGDKPKRTIDFFKEKNLLNELEIITPKPVDETDLERVHSKSYIDLVKKLSKTGGMLSFDTPAPIGIFEIACLSAGGTKLGAEYLIKNNGCMVNPLAGFHHASRANASGFCFFNDIAIAIEYIRFKYHIKRFIVIDLDVHHSNGTQEIYYEDPSVLLISFHQDGKTLYPGTGAIEKIGKNNGAGYNINLPFLPKTGSKSYIKGFDEIIKPITKDFDPELIIYQCGVDTHHLDPLGDISLVYQTFYHFGKNMNKLSKETCDKLLVLFGGGYNSLSSVKSYYNIMAGIMDKEQITEPEIIDQKYNESEKRISELKNISKPYWKV